MIQTSRPKYFITAPRDLDDLSALREELRLTGIPLIDAPKENWAKTVLFVACFILGGTLGAFAQSRILATCGWGMLAAAFLWGLLEARGNPNVSRRTMRPLSVAILLLLIVCGIFWVWHR